MIRQWVGRGVLAVLAAVLAEFVLQIAVAGEPDGKVLYTIDFSSQADGSAIPWLEQNGYIIALNAADLNPRFEGGQLVLSTDDKVAGIIGKWFDESKLLQGVERVRIEWGVLRFPEGANWEADNNRVALAAMVFFGTEKLGSGLPFGVNAAPYFISPFIAKVEPADKTYIGALYKKGGRYVSVAAPDTTGDLFTTDFEVQQRFKQVFGKSEVPAISGVAFQMNTEDTSGGAVAAIRRITFLGH
ncbi:MAG TPA: hypothetical protein VIV27_00600 [Halioglobus sp.]